MGGCACVLCYKCVIRVLFVCLCMCLCVCLCVCLWRAGGDMHMHHSRFVKSSFQSVSPQLCLGLLCISLFSRGV